MPYFTKTEICNRALDLVGKDTYLDIDTSTNTTALLVARNWQPVMLRCLRKAQWPWAIKRVTLSPSVTVPENEFSNAFSLPAGMLKLIRVWPANIVFKIEGEYILSDEDELTLKYVGNEPLTDPSVCDPAFAEYLAHELAVAISYKITDSVVLRKELKEAAAELFKEATAIFSQEDVDDTLPESPWVAARGWDDYEDGTIRIDGLET